MEALENNSRLFHFCLFLNCNNTAWVFTWAFEFKNEAQAKAFYEWFRESGFNDFLENDSVHDDLPQEDFPECLTAEEEPMENMDFYFIQIE